jgi:hypothetical protein
MGEGSEWIEASEECDGRGSCQAHHVGVSPHEDRGGRTCTLGEVQGGEEEGGLEPREPAARMRQAFPSSASKNL